MIDPHNAVIAITIFALMGSMILYLLKDDDRSNNFAYAMLVLSAAGPGYFMTR